MRYFAANHPFETTDTADYVLPWRLSGRIGYDDERCIAPRDNKRGLTRMLFIGEPNAEEQ